MRTLTSAELCEITGITPKSLDNWVRDGLLKPTNVPGMGRGGVRREFTVGDAVAVAVGMTYRKHGATPERVAGVVKFLAGLGLERLKAEIKLGNTFPVPGSLMGGDWIPGMMVPPVNTARLMPTARLLLKQIEVEPIMKAVERKVTAMNKEAVEA
jgi:hypothetical protein